MLSPAWRRLLAQLSRYWIVSVLAMALDWTIFLSLIGAATQPPAAGVVAYVAGLGFHYLLSVRFVFDATATQKGSRRLFTEFALSGLAGIAVTGGGIAMVTQVLGLGPVLGKLSAMSLSFTLVYGLRRNVVFACHA